MQEISMIKKFGHKEIKVIEPETLKEQFCLLLSVLRRIL